MNKIILVSILVQILIYCFITFGECEDVESDSETIALNNENGAQHSHPNVKSGNYFGYPGFGWRRRWGYGGWGNGGWGNGLWLGGGYGRGFGPYGR
jgi:hypothetical protein